MKCVDIRRNTSGEGDLLGRNWRWGTKAWGANRIRYPSSPRCKRWVLSVGEIQCWSKRIKYSAWEVRSQEWNLKELTGARTSGGACGLIRRNTKNLTRTWHPMQDSRDRGIVMVETGGAWLSSARVVRCLVKSSNERNPCSQLPSLSWGLWEDCRCKSEEGRDDVKSSCPLRPGLHTCYNGRYKEKRSSDVEQTSKSRSQFGLKSATRLHEAGIASNRESAKSRWIRSRALYTPPVKPWELAIPEVI